MKFKIGDKVILNGDIYTSSNAITPTKKITNKVTNVTRIAKGSKHPYNTTGDLGWCDETSLTLYEEPSKVYEVEVELTDINGLIDYLKGNPDKIIMINSDQLKKVLGL